MRSCLAQTTQDRWFKAALAWFARCAILLSVCVLAAPAQSLETLAEGYRKTPNARTRAALLRFADLHRKDTSGALAFLALGVTESEQRQFGDALNHLNAAAPRLPQLADYIAYWTGASQFELRQFQDAARSLNTIWRAVPASPLIGRAVTVQANSFLEAGQPANAIALLQQHLPD